MKQVYLKVLTNEKLTKTVCKMTLFGDMTAIERPGQFVNIQLDGLYLRRPISVCDYEDGKLSLEQLVDFAKQNGEPKQTSGKQELYEAILNMYC